VKAVFDTNVVLDVLLAREPYAVPTAKLFALVDNGLLEGSICATTATTIYYIAAKSFGAKRARAEIRALLALFDVAPVNRGVLDSALDLGSSDYEDAVVHEAARMAGADVIVTRDRKGFTNAAIPILDPAELLAVIASKT
jgi:predicted nucleic acid-binding protein